MRDGSVQVGILGLGVVGGGLYQILRGNAEQIQRVAGVGIEVAAACDIDWERPRDFSVPEALKTGDAAAVINDPDIDIIVESIGGISPALDYVTAAIKAGKSVVTPNKEMIAKHGEQILALATAHGVDLQFEGSVGGVIPILRSLKENLASARIDEVIGIVNGTTNYILTRMSEEGADFAPVLAAAQAEGYAESEPTDDIEGIDATNKLAILAALAFGQRVSVAGIYHEGISQVTPADIDYARRMGYVIKLLAIGRHDGEELELRVHPALLPADHPLAAVRGVFNAIFLRGPECGEVMLYGRGAGALPTATAVAGDVIDCARNIVHGSRGRASCTCEGEARLRPMAEVETSAYVRMQVADQPGVLGQIATVLGSNDVSIQSVIQESSRDDVAEIVWVMHRGPERNLQAALRAIQDLAAVKQVSSMIRVVE